MSGIIDFHTHAFPDRIAERAVPHLAKEGNIQAYLDGKVSSLIASMDNAGITASVVASIATRPEQFESILTWSKSIASSRIIPFPSVHPADPEAVQKVFTIASSGFKGIKLHPYYQEFFVDEERVFPLYDALEKANLILLLHTGFDMAFERVRRADPQRILRLVNTFPRLKVVTTHFGAWEDWDEVEKHLLGKPIRTDISYALQFMSPEKAKYLLSAHPAECIFFGTDSPWADQKTVVEFVRSLKLDNKLEQALFFGNAQTLLASAGSGS
ncbi:MAG TPA: TatD family hydrolase [Candidatus Hydrogenedentes bacterium]|nr:TatD family hydrolase [Candidatus Hydrogenedentota bacterium]HOL76790.1 TatD family hydrolase [Candidatus Hydrogenedentota bacterium]HPO85733.1 TatD family hydrolase [Candidatus Hydrogenedentota bacterium]